jgi:uncharacterized protein (DUF1015 family)
VQTLPSDPGPGLALVPFRGIRYARDRVSGIANVTSPPYDVISGSILEHLRGADPHNVVRLILPGDDADANQVAAGLLHEWLSEGVLIPDPAPVLYLYEQAGEAAAWLQRGIISLVRLGPPGTAGILPHESVMPGPVAGRRALMAATQANLEPIFLIYDGKRAGGAAEMIDAVAAERAPLVSVSTEDGVTHRLWRLDQPGESEAIIADLAGGRALIADGHHRYAAYLDLQAEMRSSGRGAGPWDYGMAFLVASDAYPPRLGAIHRVLPGLPPEQAAELAKAAFTVQELPGGSGLDRGLEWLAAAGREGTAFLLAGGSPAQTRFWLLSQPDPVQVTASMPAGTSAQWQSLDASVMQQLLIGRLWGIADSERDVLINHDAADAVSVAISTGATAVICNPPSFESVIQIAAQGERVPRKSTSFGPKPRTGLVLRTFEQAG